jgi:hypothetical protein
VDSVYPFLAFKGIDWDAVHATYGARAGAARGDEGYRVLHEMLAELRDGHVYYRPPGGGEVYPHLPPRQARDRGAYDPFVVRRYFPEPLRLSPSGKIEYGLTRDSVGYALIADFDEDYLAGDFPGVLTALRAAKGLVLDVRQRKGGTIQNVDAVVSRFLTAPLTRPAFYLLGRRLDWAPLQPAGPTAYARPVVVLINGSTFSAGEHFAEAMRQIPAVTLVGDTTGGGGVASTGDVPCERRLPSGKWICVGAGDIRRFDGQPVEWLGVPPDIRVAQTEDDIRRGRDPQLEAAIGLLGGAPVAAARSATAAQRAAAPAPR